MKENKYDNEEFFIRYSRMDRSVKGLQGTGEWHILQTMLPEIKGRRVLDPDCGLGWHCIYAVRQGAAAVTEIDLSQKMIDSAKQRNADPRITYCRMAVEDFDYEPESFDLGISSLTFHYLESFDDICRNVHRTLTPGGAFVFPAEHPIFTAERSQEWVRADRPLVGRPLLQRGSARGDVPR